MNRRDFLRRASLGTLGAAGAAVGASAGLATVAPAEIYAIKIIAANRTRVHPYAVSLGFIARRGDHVFCTADVTGYELLSAAKALAGVLRSKAPDAAAWVLDEWYPGVVDLQQLPGGHTE